jgi:hypothetical protein
MPATEDEDEDNDDDDEAAVADEPLPVIPPCTLCKGRAMDTGADGKDIVPR